MLGEAKIKMVKVYTNNEKLKESLKGYSYINLEVINRVLNSTEENNLSSYEDIMKRIIPYGNKKEISTLHYPEELAIMDSEYRRSIHKNSEEIFNLNIIDYSEEKFNLKDFKKLENNINIITGVELCKSQLNKISKGESLIINMPKVEDCIECIKYFYICFNSVHYFPEEFQMICENMKGKCITNLIVSNKAEEIVNYMNFEYEDKHNGVFVSMYKGKSLKRFGEYMNMLERKLHIGECTLFCNEYYNCESDDEYYLGFVI